ncbi:MAG: SIR2 family protein [Acholeplasmataceae bacterium]|jgi:hypothetical protein
MSQKNPYEFISGISQVLASDKKRIGFLCGAGTSFAKNDATALNVPNINGITNRVVDKIKTEDSKFKTAIEEIVSEITDPNIERILDLLEKKIDAVGNSKLNGLSKEELICLRQKIHVDIYDIVSVISIDTPKEEIVKLPHNEFVKWIGRASRKYPIEIFTTNYDYFFESAFEINEIPYYDGFTGSLNPFFHSLSVEDFSYLPKETKLWKIHGSLGWKQVENRVIRSKSNSENKDLLIYPSSLKYTNSKKMPYVSLVDRLCAFIEQDEAVLFVIGYSFGDEHINERIITSLKKSHNSQVFAFIYDKKQNGESVGYQLQKDSIYMELGNQSSKISFIGMKTAIIGGKFIDWHIDSGKSSTSDTIKSIISLNEDETFNELLIPDFAKFVDYISSMVVRPSMEES